MEVVRVEINQSGADWLIANSFKEAPWKLLRGILSTHCDARDITLSKLIRTDVDYCDSTGEAVRPSNDLQLSSFDFFHIVLQCCDRTLQTIVFQKLYLCKIAVPFAFTDWDCEQPKLTVSTWPLRFLMVETKQVSDTCSVSTETDIMFLKTKVTAFARFGRPKLSKSKLLNILLDTKNCNHFFDEDSFSGHAKKTISNGCIEMFLFPTTGNDKDLFDTHVTFLDVRGDLISDIVTFLGEFSDTVVIVTDIHCMRTQPDLFQKTVSQFASVVLLFSDCLTPKDKTFINTTCNNVRQQKSKFKFVYICLTDKDSLCTPSRLKNRVLTAIKGMLIDAVEQTLENRLAKTTCKTDEIDPSCQEGKEMAENVLKKMKKEGHVKLWKEKLCPAHFIHSIELGETLKHFHRAKSIESVEKKRDKISKIRRLQMANISESVKLFASFILKANRTDTLTEFFLGWLNHLIEREKARVLPDLIREYKISLNTLYSEKEKVHPDVTNISAKETEVRNNESSIDNASFSCDDFFQELAHIFDAYLEERDVRNFYFKSFSEEIADVFAKRIFNGHSLEVVDEKGFYMPYKWIQAVFNKLSTYIGSERIICLSVQGLESSGKSTLLNTMFGSQFPVKVGRCTRGLHMQLVPVQFENSAEMPFRYIAVFDTEGLRSTEAHCASHEHDNELATVITGIGDITIMNIMGESIAHMNEILQVVVLAFLRLKKSNSALDVVKTCYFVHHNVRDQSASQNMRRSMHTLIQTLDQMTKESAQREGALDVKTFNQVIRFDPDMDVSYLKSLWSDDSPMASVSSEYVEEVARLKFRIIRRAINKEKTYWKLGDLLSQMHSLWDGVLKENFVFSFRNTMEIKVQTEMNRFVEKKLREFNKSVNEQCRMDIQRNFAVSKNQESVEEKANETKQFLIRYLNDQKSLLLKDVDLYFQKHYREIASHWQDVQHQSCEMLCFKLAKDIECEIEKRRDIRMLEILTNESQQLHEKQLMKESLSVAAEIRNQGRTISEREENDSFDNIWKSFIRSMNMRSILFPKTKLQSEFVNSLTEMFGADELKEYLLRSDSFAENLSIKHLVDSFKFTGIDENDCGWYYCGERQLVVGNDEMETLRINVNDMFSQFDQRIDGLDNIIDYIWEPEVRSFIYDLRNSIDEMKMKKIIVCRKSFEIKLFVHVCHYACQRFNEHNHNHFENQTQKRLNGYKNQLKITFKARLRDRQFEATFASMLCNVLETFAEEKLHIDMTYRIKEYLHSKVPENKRSLIISVLKSLVSENNYGNFISYIKLPESYAGMWFMRLCNRYLYDIKTEGYYTEARSAANDIYKRITMALSSFVTNHKGDQCLDAQQCIDEIKGQLASQNLVIQDDSFRVMRSETGQITNVENFEKLIQDLISKSREKMLDNIPKVPESIVKWHDFNPIDAVFKHVWGCREQCPYCWEPCENSADHGGIKHSCIQHRRLCCTGSQTKNKRSVFLNLIKFILPSKDVIGTLETCNFLVNSDMFHNCDTIDFKCNKPNYGRCVKERHEYRDYRTFFSEWDIHPSSDMLESSKFWLWFVAKYEGSLTKEYNYQFGPIPPSWREIKPEEAIESLGNSAKEVVGCQKRQ